MTDTLTIGNKHYRLEEAYVITTPLDAAAAHLGTINNITYKRAFVLVEVEDTDEQAP